MEKNSYFLLFKWDRASQHYVKIFTVIFIILLFYNCNSIISNNNLLFLWANQTETLMSEKYELINQLNRNNTQNCPLCKINLTIFGGDSTTKDVAVCFAFRRVHSLVPFLRTFRSITNATFVLILDKEAWSTLPEKIITLISSCGGLIIHLDYRVTYSFFDDKTLYRSKIHAYATFLELYHEYFDRVLFFDLEDTIFQADPFRMDYYDTRHYINLCKENLIIKDSFSNNKDIKKLKLSNWNEVKYKQVINGATSIGPAHIMLKWMKMIDYEC